MKDQTGKRLVFGDFVDRTFWGLLVVVGVWGGHQIQKLNESLESLNLKMVEVVSEFKSQKDYNSDKFRSIEIRLEKIEDRLNKK